MMEVPLRQIHEYIVAVIMGIPQDRMSERHFEQIVDATVLRIQ